MSIYLFDLLVAIVWKSQANMSEWFGHETPYLGFESSRGQVFFSYLKVCLLDCRFLSVS